MNDFYINQNLLYIYGNTNECKSIFVDNMFKINQSINKYIDINCKYYGSSLKGKKESSNFLLNNSYKCPIYINNEILLFNIKINNNSYWINFKQILKLNFESSNIKIYFKNNDILTLDTTKFKINNQLLKCSMLERLLIGKI